MILWPRAGLYFSFLKAGGPTVTLRTPCCFSWLFLLVVNICKFTYTVQTSQTVTLYVVIYRYSTCKSHQLLMSLIPRLVWE